MESIFYPSNDGVTTVHAVIWACEKPKACVQIIHGMAEYAKRYAPFAEFLVSQGFAVCAEDHLGHGKTASDEAKMGYFSKDRKFETVLADVYSLTTHMKGLYPDVPYFVLGHSMGSFFLRNYLAKYSAEIAGAIIMGTGFKSGLTTSSALFLTRANALFKGWEHRSSSIRKLAFGSYNKRFKGGSKNAWLSKNEANVQRYDADPYCGFDFTNNGYYILFSVIKAACKQKTFASVRKDLPIYLVAGQDDPVGDYGKGVIKTFNHYKKAKLTNVSIKLYEQSRHEILNDDKKDEVSGDILDFIQRTIN